MAISTVLIKDLISRVTNAARGAAVMAVVACGAAQHPPAEQSAATAETIQEESAGEAPACVDEKEQPVSCLSDSDCCAGFVCGKDPELSQRMSYCIYGG